MKTRNLYLVLLVIFSALFTAAYTNSAAGQNPTEIAPLVFDNLPEFRITKGEVLYNRYCIFCHGETGAGDGLNAFSIPVKPFSLSNQELLDQKSDEELEKVILHGGEAQGLSRYMPSFSNTLADFQVQYLIDFIRKQLSAKNSSKNTEL